MTSRERRSATRDRARLNADPSQIACPGAGDADPKLREVVLRRRNHHEEADEFGAREGHELQSRPISPPLAIRASVLTTWLLCWLTKASFWLVAFLIALSSLFEWNKAIKIIKSVLGCLFWVSGSCSDASEIIFPDSDSRDSYQLMIKVIDPTRNVTSSVAFETQFPILIRNPIILGLFLLFWVVLNMLFAFLHLHFAASAENADKVIFPDQTHLPDQPVA